MSLFLPSPEGLVTESRFAIGSNKYRHSFGGPPVHSGTIFDGCSKAVDLLFMIDLDDPQINIASSRFRVLPLYYPLRFDGADLTYRVQSDDAIQILDLSSTKWLHDWPYEGYPEPWPKRPIIVEPPIHMSKYLENNDYREWWLEEKAAAPEADHYAFITMVKGLNQSDVPRPCDDPACAHPMNILSVVNNRPFADVNLWGEFGDSVSIVHYICPECHLIHTCNHCD